MVVRQGLHNTLIFTFLGYFLNDSGYIPANFFGLVLIEKRYSVLYLWEDLDTQILIQ
jgi:hypothetical protein